MAKKNPPTPEWLLRNGFMKTEDGVWRHFKDGFMHNIDGPAAFYPNGQVAYYINGHRLSRKAFAAHLAHMKRRQASPLDMKGERKVA